MARLRARILRVLIRRGSWAPLAGALERVRNATTYALGAGSASLPVSESGEEALLRELAEPWAGRELTVVDVGAHHGDWAAAARQAFGPRAAIHCFEPNPQTFERLAERMGGDGRTHCHRLALGAEPGSAELLSEAASAAFSSLHRRPVPVPGHQVSRVDRVELSTLDAQADELGLGAIDLLKLDVEGHELAVLRGAQGLLDAGAVAAVQFEFGERNLSSRTYLLDFFELLAPAFELYRVTPAGLRRLSYSPAAEVFVMEANYLALRAAAP